MISHHEQFGLIAMRGMGGYEFRSRVTTAFTHGLFPESFYDTHHMHAMSFLFFFWRPRVHTGVPYLDLDRGALCFSNLDEFSVVVWRFEREVFCVRHLFLDLRTLGLLCMVFI